MTGDESPLTALSEQIRHDVWNGLLDAERNTRYYGKQFQESRSWQRRLDAVQIFSGALAILVIAINQWVSAVLLIIGGIVSVYSQFCKYSEKSVHQASIRRECASLGEQWQELWSRVQLGLLGDEEALRKNQELLTALRVATERADIVGLKEDKQANQLAWEESREVKANQYAYEEN